MKKHTIAIATAAVLAALVAVPIAFAQHERHMRGDGFGGGMFFGHLGHVKSQLGLTDQQTSDIKAIFQQLKEQNQPYRDSMRSTMQQVAQTLINNPNDVAAAQALINQQADAERTMKLNALNAASKALNVLTPDQRGKLSAMMQEHIGRMQK